MMLNATDSASRAASAFGAHSPAPQPTSQEAQRLDGVSPTSRSAGSYEQLTLDVAIEAGAAGMAQALNAAERRDPDFARKAEAAIVNSLRGCKQRRASSEDLVDAARAAGLNPVDDRCFGPVFQSMARRGVIRFVGYCLRKKGHGTAGGRIWALCQ